VAIPIACPAAAHARLIDETAFRCTSRGWIPDNVTIQSDYLLALTNDMASRSLGFRSRLGQIGSSPYFRGTLRFVWRTLSPSAIAQTNFARTKAGWLFADIQIPARLVFVRQDVEMIAHEIEHVIEQIEGLDLKTLARQPGSGVYPLHGLRSRLFETDRASAFGRRVKRDFEHNTVALCAAN
jgi:hypothetical protein